MTSIKIRDYRQDNGASMNHLIAVYAESGEENITREWNSSGELVTKEIDEHFAIVGVYGKVIPE